MSIQIFQQTQDNLLSPTDCGVVDAAQELVSRSHVSFRPRGLFELLFLYLGKIRPSLFGHHFTFLVHPPSTREAAVSQLLGFVAEACIVRDCVNYRDWNRRWARIARRGKREVATPDEYLAVGTGLWVTKEDPLLRHKYNASDRRDIVWVDKAKRSDELQEIGRKVGCGLQVKISRCEFPEKLTSDLRSGKYDVPVIYFDLSNNYREICELVRPYATDGVHVFRGKDIAPDIHIELTLYADQIRAIHEGRLSADALLRETEALAVGTKVALLQGAKSNLLVGPSTLVN